MHSLEHSSNLLLVHVLVQSSVKVIPPLEQHGVANKLKPGCELEGGLIKQLLQLLCTNVLCVSNFVDVDIEINVGLDEEDVVD